MALAGTLTGTGTAAVLGPSFAYATHPLWWTIAVGGLIVLVLGLIATTPWATETSEAVRRSFETAEEGALAGPGDATGLIEP